MYLVEKLRIDGHWVSVAQIYCASQNYRELIHKVACDPQTRIRETQDFIEILPTYRFELPNQIVQV
jgi:hypothetical protein